jgi:hypothetical protein
MENKGTLLIKRTKKAIITNSPFTFFMPWRRAKPNRTIPKPKGLRGRDNKFHQVPPNPSLGLKKARIITRSKTTIPMRARAFFVTSWVSTNQRIPTINTQSRMVVIVSNILIEGLLARDF